jgi:hypothetical protein
MARGSVKGIVPAGALNQLVTAHQLLRLGERPVGYQHLQTADLDRGRLTRRFQRAAAEQCDTALPHLVGKGRPARRAHPDRAASPSGLVPLLRISSMYFTAPS